MKQGGTSTSPQQSECQQVLANFITSEESGGACLDPGCEETPLVFDLDGGGISTTDLVFAVVFDIDGDARDELTSWLNYATEDAFLWMDLNGNGRVDGGQEFFGSASTLPDGAVGGVSNGFEALALYDQARFGGNGNGVIDRRDRVWSRLMLWIDRDYDAQSRPQEIVHIQRAGIIEIDLSYTALGTVDGNQNTRVAEGVYRVRGIGGRLETRRVEDVAFRVGQ